MDRINRNLIGAVVQKHYATKGDTYFFTLLPVSDSASK